MARSYQIKCYRRAVTNRDDDRTRQGDC
ncbi:hypothetical protein DSM3645_03218 [Blastopirellula marina DSM 3645]|uniref:Uncharacterized protein n=1 Tax=Blastopirellula marina DSM 3645 TaxID=314230 RepID=A3ZVV7_9BACT|nr:hypothetical protein DSM3645_03218 [Blastopirellula marina DSM 3645]